MSKWTEPGDVPDVTGMQQPVDHVEHEQRLHAVVGKAFPGFGEREIAETARVADKAAILRIVHGRRVLRQAEFGKHRHLEGKTRAFNVAGDEEKVRMRFGPLTHTPTRWVS